MSAVLQNVNLYLPEFRRKKYWLDGEKTLLLLGLGILALGIATGAENVQLLQLRAELADKEQQYESAAAATQALRDQFGVQSEDPALLENIRQLQENLASKQALLQFLSGRELGNADGFSEHLADLARYHVSGVSLDRISLTNGGRAVEFSGQVAQPDLVTLYLQNLDKGSVYSGMSFEMFNIADDPATAGSAETAGNAPQVWNFQVRSLKP